MRGLTDMTGLRRANEVPLVGKRDEITQLLQRHGVLA